MSRCIRFLTKLYGKVKTKDEVDEVFDRVLQLEKEKGIDDFRYSIWWTLLTLNVGDKS